MQVRVVWLSAVCLIGVMPEASAEAPALCGRPGELVQLMLETQKPTVEHVWRDKKMFVTFDSADGSYFAFSLKSTTVHPAVVCVRDVQDASGTKTETGQICTAGEKACASFAEQVSERLAALKAAKK